MHGIQAVQLTYGGLHIFAIMAWIMGPELPDAHSLRQM